LQLVWVSLLVKSSAPFSRSELAQYLASHAVGNRMLFGGNFSKQPAFVQLRKERPSAIRQPLTEMSGADRLMNQAIFLGTYPGLTPSML
jgi:CDP-6-deoxy-D-xylo-4-hexulose-3-dehydrase